MFLGIKKSDESLQSNRIIVYWLLIVRPQYTLNLMIPCDFTRLEKKGSNMSVWKTSSSIWESDTIGTFL